MQKTSTCACLEISKRDCLPSHAPRLRHFLTSKDSGKVETKKKKKKLNETGSQERESAVETFHKSGGGSRVTKAILCSRSLLTLVRRSSGIGKTERGKAGQDITRFDHTSTDTNAPGSQVFFLPRTITLRNRFHHRTRLHRTDSPSQQGVLERNAEGIEPESDTEVEKTAARWHCTHRAGEEDSVTQPTGKQEESWRLGRSALVKKPSPLSSEEERTSENREKEKENASFFV